MNKDPYEAPTAELMELSALPSLLVYQSSGFAAGMYEEADVFSPEETDEDEYFD